MLSSPDTQQSGSTMLMGVLYHAVLRFSCYVLGDDEDEDEE